MIPLLIVVKLPESPLVESKDYGVVNEPYFGSTPQFDFTPIPGKDLLFIENFKIIPLYKCTQLKKCLIKFIMCYL